MRYLAILAASAAASLALVWVWVLAMPMAFMDPEYASWQAKQTLLDSCDLGQVVIVGDSRAAADILPPRLPLRTTNLAIGGGEAIEAFYTLGRVLACPDKPRLVLISLDPGHFVRPDLFWQRSVRFGLLDSLAITDFRAESLSIGDLSVYGGRQHDGLPLIVRDVLERMDFPPLYFASLVRGGVFLRWSGNRDLFAATLADRGHYEFGTANGSDAVALDGHLPDFRPLPVVDRYFDRLLALLAENHIESRFIAMPVNEATWQEVRPAVRQRFGAYLSGYEQRYPLFHVAADLMPHWPNRFFGDQFCHLNREGAERFTAELSQRLQDAPPSTQNEAQKGWLSETGRDAAASVAPISKRGS